MSSRGGFLGAGPNAGVYTPRPVPSNQEDIPSYINDELLSLGGKLNNIVEGGVFPPQTAMPKRYKEGMVMYFANTIEEKGITEPGVWLYKNNKWFKVIDNPDALSRNLQVYKLENKDVTPTKPPANKYKEGDLKGWVYTPPYETGDKVAWTSIANDAYIGDNPKVKWSDPVVFNSKGEDGSGFKVIVNDAYSKNWPSNATEVFKDYFKRYPSEGDILTFVSIAKDLANTRIFTNNNWEDPGQIIDGSLLVRGSVTADRIVGGYAKFGPGGPYDGYNTSISTDGHIKTNRLTTSGSVEIGGNVNITGSGTIGGSMKIDGTISAGNIVGDLVEMFDVPRNGSITIPAAPWNRSIKLIPVRMYAGSSNTSSTSTNTVNMNGQVYTDFVENIQFGGLQYAGNSSVLSAPTLTIPARQEYRISYENKAGFNAGSDESATVITSKY